MTEKKTTAAAGEARDLVTAMLNIQEAGLKPLRVFGMAWLEGAGEVGSELMQFMAERIREDVKTQHEIMNCRVPAELQAIQSRFVQRTIDQYTAETGRLVEIGTGVYDKAAKSFDS